MTISAIKTFRRAAALRRCRGGRLPEAVCGYVRAFSGSQRLRRSLQDTRFVVFDTETTGFSPAKDSVISIGAVAVDSGAINVGDSYEVLIRRDDIGDREVVTIHGLLRKDLSQGVDEKAAIEGFLGYIGDSVLVAQHAGFDIMMMNAMLKRRYGLELFNEVIDTASLAKRLEKGPYYNLAHKSGEYRLDHLLERYGIRLYDRHTSAGDALLTARLFQILLANARQAGIAELKDLLLK